MTQRARPSWAGPMINPTICGSPGCRFAHPGYVPHDDELKLRRRARQQLPVVALLLPVHQDVQVLWRLLAVVEFLRADEVEAHDRGSSDDADRGIPVFERLPLVILLRDAVEQARLGVD